MQDWNLRGVAAAAILAATPLAAAEDGIRQVDLNLLELAEIPNLDGVSAAFVQGAFDAEGVYAARSQMEAGSVFPPHAHPDIRITMVTSGTMYLGEGERFDEGALVAYPVGTVAVTPPGTWHFMAARDAAVTLLEIGSGPSGTVFAAEPSP